MNMNCSDCGDLLVRGEVVWQGQEITLCNDCKAGLGPFIFDPPHSPPEIKDE